MLRRIVQAKFFVWVVALSFVVLSGCAKPPTKEIEIADKAVAEAKQKEADLYVQDVFAKAEEALKKAKGFVVEKKYKEAKSAAAEALSLAQQSLAMIEPNKAKMKTDAEQILIDVQTSLGELKSSVAAAIKKKAPINREEIQGMIGKWEIDLVNIKDQLQSEKTRQAYDLLVSLQAQVKSQKEGIAAAMEPVSAKK